VILLVATKFRDSWAMSWCLAVYRIGSLGEELSLTRRIFRTFLVP